MKQISLLQGKVLLIELPEWAESPIYEEDDPNLLYWIELGETEMSTLPSGNWRIIGMLSEVTEEQAALVVPIHRQSIIGDIYKNFKTDKWDAFDALESLESAILAEGWYFENPLENERKKIGLGTLDNFDQDYEQAQSRVLDRSRCLLLGREI